MIALKCPGLLPRYPSTDHQCLTIRWSVLVLINNVFQLLVRLKATIDYDKASEPWIFGLTGSVLISIDPSPIS